MPTYTDLRTASVRRARLLLIAGLCALALAFVQAQPASAYALLGSKWSTSSIKYYVPSAYSSYSTWTAAAGLWSGVDATLTYTTGTTHFTATQENRGNTVNWSGITRKPGTVEGYPEHTSLYWVPGGMEVVLNWSGITNYTTAQKKMVAAHELGHAFGLAHNNNTQPASPGVPVALMYYADASRIAANILTPKPDDKAGVNALY
jgi:hypothetical protein